MAIFALLAALLLAGCATTHPADREPRAYSKDSGSGYPLTR